MPTKPILLLGKNGQVGHALQGALAALGPVQALDRAACDVAKADDIRRAIRSHAPAVIVNAAAYTAVDQAESDEAAAAAINATAPGVMAEEARSLGALLVHYSTDYVFDGAKAGAWREDDATGPVNAYGRSKLGGDLAISAAGGRHLILRVAWVYSATGRNFAKTILRLAAERDRLTIVSDQFGAPTSAEFIAKMTAEAIAAFLAQEQAGAAPSGVYHLAPSGVASWHAFAVALVQEARRQGLPVKVSDEAVAPIASKDYPTPARRPANSALDTGKLQKLLGHAMPDWREDVTRVVRELAMAR
jgi:dTDP-4-dehydrorhamnose reductase